jgi:hypothetical protein
MHLYMKIGKRNGKKKKRRDFPPNWAGGDFGPAGARARAAARQAAQPAHGRGERRGDGAVGVGPRASEEGERR